MAGVNRRFVLLGALAGLIVVAAVGAGLFLILRGDDENATDPLIVESYHVLSLTPIHETEYSIEPKQIVFDRHAYYGLEVRNEGDETHAFRIKGPGLERETQDIEPGSSTSIAVFLRRSGRYELSCPIDGHAGKGMRATLIVR